MTRIHLACLCCFFQKLPAVLDELESLKPKFRRLQNEANKTHAGTHEYQLDVQERNSNGSEASHSEWPLVNRKASLSLNNKQVISQYMRFYCVIDVNSSAIPFLVVFFFF